MASRLHDGLRFKLKSYNRGGYLRFDDGGIIDENDIFSSSQEVQGVKRSQGKKDQFMDFAQGAAKNIPVFGNLISSGIGFEKSVSKMTKDENGIYKSKGAEVVDKIQPMNQFTNIANLAGDFSWDKALNTLSFGLFGSDADQEKLKREKYLATNKAAIAQYSNNEQAGALARNAVGGFQAAPYGRKGMKLLRKSKFSKSC